MPAETVQTNEKQKKKKRIKRYLKQILLRFLIVGVFIFVAFTFVFGLIRNSGNSMYPMVKDGDLCMYYRLDNYYYENLVIYRHNGKDRIGRIIALNGQTVTFPEEGGYEVDDTVMNELLPYKTFKAENSNVIYPLTLAEDEYFILNDYRDNTDDSRSFGAVKRKDIKGKVIYILRRRSF